jgi:chemotaxis protein histidine kinase CheA
MRRTVLMLAVFVSGGVLLTTLTGCGEAYQKYQTPGYAPSRNELTRIADEWPDGDPLKPTAQAVALERFATAQTHESAAEAAAATQQAERDRAERQYAMMTAEAQQTAQAHQREMDRRRQWATQQAANATQVYDATRAAVAAQATTEARHAQATAIERAARATGTAVVVSRRATTTAQKQYADATMTKQAANDAATATRGAWEARTTSTAESHTSTAMMAHATMTRQAERREETLGAVRDYGLPIVLILAAGAVAMVGFNMLRDFLNRPVQYDRSILGDFQPLAFKDGRGGWTLVDLDRQPGHVTRVLPGGDVDAPQVRNAGQEERTTARDQMTDASTRPKLGPGHRSESTPELSMESASTVPAPGLRSVRVLRQLEHIEQAGFLPGPLLESVETDWEADE